MIDHLDHIVLTTCDEDACVHFYVDILGMQLENFGVGRKAFRFGNQKINVHVKGGVEKTWAAAVAKMRSSCFRSGADRQEALSWNGRLRSKRRPAAAR